MAEAENVIPGMARRMAVNRGYAKWIEELNEEGQKAAMATNSLLIQADEVAKKEAEPLFVTPFRSDKVIKLGYKFADSPIIKLLQKRNRATYKTMVFDNGAYKEGSKLYNLQTLYQEDDKIRLNMDAWKARVMYALAKDHEELATLAMPVESTRTSQLVTSRGFSKLVLGLRRRGRKFGRRHHKRHHRRLRHGLKKQRGRRHRRHRKHHRGGAMVLHHLANPRPRRL